MSLLAILEGYGVHVRSTWGEVRTACPFVDHPDTHPSFSANLDLGVWVCHACGRKGNSLTLVAQMEGISNSEARSRIGETMGGSFLGLPSADEPGGSYLPEWARHQYNLGRDLSVRPSRRTSSGPRDDGWKNMYSLH